MRTGSTVEFVDGCDDADEYKWGSREKVRLNLNPAAIFPALPFALPDRKNGVQTISGPLAVLNPQYLCRKDARKRFF